MILSEIYKKSADVISDSKKILKFEIIYSKAAKIGEIKKKLRFFLLL